MTRDYRLALDASPGQAPLLTVFGGKLTTYRRLAEHALDRLKGVMEGVGSPWTDDAHLPGGDLDGKDFEGFCRDLTHDYPWLPQPLARRYAGAYGSRVERLLADARSLEDLGLHLGGGLYEAEVRYQRQHEWAHTARDILWRRSKLGLHVSGATVENLEMWLATN